MKNDSDADQKRLIADLRAAVAARDEFIAIAAHELRNPVTPIVAQAQLIATRARREGASDALLKSIDNLQLAVDHYLRRATMLLEISRVNAGSMRLQPEAFDLRELVRDCVRNYEQMAAHAGSTFEVSGVAPIVGYWDRMALEQVLDNLLSNAVRYGDGKEIRIELTADDGRAEVAVIDRGIGIAAEDRARIFERFERAVGNAAQGGFGIGLWLSHQLVLAHGGELEVDSAIGRGSRFVVRLPRRTPAEAQQ